MPVDVLSTKDLRINQTVTADIKRMQMQEATRLEAESRKGASDSQSEMNKTMTSLKSSILR